MRNTYEPLPLSEAVLSRIERVSRALYAGPGSTSRPRASTRALTEAVAALSHTYTRERSELGRAATSKGALLARCGFFFARDLPKVFGPLDELLRVGWRPGSGALRVLDVGAGLGATSLGVARWLRLRALPNAELQIVALEQSEQALRIFQELARALNELTTEFASAVITPAAGDLRSAQTAGKFDLILFGFVLNELFRELPSSERAARRSELLLRAGAQLAPGGAIIVLEPALRESARELMEVRDLIAARAAAPFVIAPCLHAQSCPMLPSARDWCHQELPYALPPALAEVARGASLRYEGLRYASLVLAPAARPAPAPLLRVVSDPIETKGKLELFACSETGYQRLMRLARDEREANAAFGAARRGDILELQPPSLRIAADTKVRRDG